MNVSLHVPNNMNEPRKGCIFMTDLLKEILDIWKVLLVYIFGQISWYCRVPLTGAGYYKLYLVKMESLDTLFVGNVENCLTVHCWVAS